MKPLDINFEPKYKFDLRKEYEKALKDPVFAKVVSKLKMPETELFNYTSMLEDSASEYRHCMECSSLASCTNRLKGHVYVPNNIEGQLQFEYKSCRFYDKYQKNTRYLNNITYFKVPEALKEATISKIHKNDKNRFDAILWVNKFYNDYPNEEHGKGLYLYGNFGCGKSYMIAALLNDLAKLGYRSAIIFWPEFVRQTFEDDFNDMYDEIKKLPLLLIDDIGAEHNSAWSRDEVLGPLLQYRMDEKLPTFFTSNLTLEELEEHLANSKTGVESVKAARIIARIKQLSEPLKMISKNLRN